MHETITSDVTADGVLSHEKRRLQLETALKEREQELNIHYEMLSSQYRAADQERMQINKELHTRIEKVEKLIKRLLSTCAGKQVKFKGWKSYRLFCARYEILMVSMAPPEGEEERSNAYYVIKAAQDKEELQREGDALDANIRKAEKEIRALENTLRVLNGRNEQYRKSFKGVTDSSEFQT